MLILFSLTAIAGMLGAMYYLNVSVNAFERTFSEFSQKIESHFSEAFVGGPNEPAATDPSTR